MKTLIIEDEIRAAEQLSTMLKSNLPEVHISAVLESVEDSIQWFKNNSQPDLIFMDIQLADGLSFEIFQSAKIEAPVIFITAFDQYSIKAFKVNSIDYLLKPIQEKELQTALKKYQSFYKKDNTPQIDALTIEKLINNLVPDKSRERFIVKEGASMSFIQVADIAYFYSEDGISFVMTHQHKRYIIDMTLDAIEKDLNTKTFFRINRSQIINIQAVEKIHPYFNHRLKLDLKGNNKVDFIVSRNRATNFKSWVNQ